MRNFRLAAMLLLSSPLAFAIQDCELNGEHVNPANDHTTEGKTGIMKCRERDSGAGTSSRLWLE